ncbi:uncharacterized protein LOC144509483 [Mustelus asterias]
MCSLEDRETDIERIIEINRFLPPGDWCADRSGEGKNRPETAGRYRFPNRLVPRCRLIGSLRRPAGCEKIGDNRERNRGSHGVSVASIGIDTVFTVLSKPMVYDRPDIFHGVGDTEFFFPFIPTPFHPAMERDSLEMRDCHLSAEHNTFKDLLATVTTSHSNTEQPGLPVKPVLPSIDFLMSPNKIKYNTDLKLQEKPSNQRMRWNKQGQSVHLWEFVRDLLLSPRENQDILRWEDRRAGIFRVVKSNVFAQLWGNKKNNKGMNYEKLSRALRHYYKTGILERVDGRLTYKFGAKSYGWEEPGCP